jgi:hypothetical protein
MMRLRVEVRVWIRYRAQIRVGASVAKENNEKETENARQAD